MGADGGKAPPLQETLNGGRKTGQNRAIGKARRGIGVRCCCRGDVGGNVPPL